MKSIRERGGKKKLEGIFVVEIKTEINDSGKGELERLTYFKNHIKTVGEGGTPLAVFLAHQPASGLDAEVRRPPWPSSPPPSSFPGLLGEERGFQSSLAFPSLQL